MSFAVNVDPRWETGRPSAAEIRRYGIDWVRMLSLPENEDYAAECLANGAQVLAVYTSESDDAGRHVLSQCSALQIGNEWAMGGEASWPTGTADDFVNVWSHVANVLVPAVHPRGLPLVGPGLWIQDYANWRKIAHRLPGLSAAACHVYNLASSQIGYYASRYRNTRVDLPLICSEWTARQPDTLAVAREIDRYCEKKMWFAFGNGVPGHELVGTPELGVLALAR